MGSGFNRIQIDSTALDNLTVLGRVWGYVKYHHPVFADNKRFDIDYELFGLLPQVADADPATHNRILAQWIDRLGKYTVNKERYDTLPPDDIGRQRMNLNWIKDSLK